MAQSDCAMQQRSDSLYAKGVELYHAHKYKKAIPFFEQSFRIDTTLYDINNPRRQYSSQWLASCYFRIGDIVQAKNADYNYYSIDPIDRRQTVDIDSLINLASSYEKKNEYGKAIDCREKSLALMGSRIGKCVKYANTLTNIGVLYSNFDYNSSIEYFEKALKIKSDILGYNHEDCINLINNLLIMHYMQGNYLEALKYAKLNNQNITEVYVQNSEEFISNLSDIALILSDMGEMEKSLSIYLRLEKYLEAQKSNNQIRLYDIVLNNIGVIYQNLEDCNMALKYYEKALSIRKDLYGEYSSQYTTTLDNIATAYQIIGSYDKSLEFRSKAINLIEKSPSIDSLCYARYFNNIGGTYKDLKQKDKALEYFNKALEIQIKKIGCDHPDVANTLINIANIDTTKSNQYYQMAKDILGHTSGVNSLNYINCVKNIATTQRIKHNYVEAINNYTSVLDSISKYYGVNNSLYISILHNIGFCNIFLGNFFEGANYYQRAMTLSKGTLMSNFSFMTVKERENYWKTTNSIYSDMAIINYFLPDDSLQTQYTYDAELVAKGLLLTSEIEFNNLIAESGNAELVSEYESMRTKHILLSKELEKPLPERLLNCDSLENEIQKIEKHIIENSRQYGDFTRSIAINWKDVQKSLSANDVAIEFTNYSYGDSTLYAAVVLTKSMKAPVFVPLFDKSEIARLQRGIAPAKMPNPTEDENRGASSFSNKRLGIYESTGLYEVLWKPLEKYFPENPRIYFAPSGILHQIGIEYAQTDQEQMISDKYEIYRVSSTRFLAMDYMPRPLKKSVLYGGVYYDSDTTTMKEESKRFSSRGIDEIYTSFAAFNKNEERDNLNYLPGTKVEVETISTLLKKKKIKSTLYEGAQANEESFKALSGQEIPIIHFATHGFFLESERKLISDRSLVQSGLLLSGANYAWQNMTIPEGVEDGILTAKEISHMDLRNTDLVVLSACQTGLGEITDEGVFGLQRGFKKAGVRTIIMSLWSVDDNATQLMMTEFYKNLTDGMSKREAFIAAQKTVKTTPGFEKFIYWAAFIMLDGNE